MLKTVDNRTIEHVATLAQLELAPGERKQAGEDMAGMLAYVNKLRELNPESVEPLTHLLPVENVFREDVVTEGKARKDMLANAPAAKDDMFVVPRTIDEA